VYSHKISGAAIPELPGKASAPSSAEGKAPATAASTVSQQQPIVSRSIPALIAATGLPIDKLSASVVSFARFFSLPIKPELMAAIRRQAVSSPTPQPDSIKLAAAENAAESHAAKSREALLLAAAAAESKGVELHPKGLEAFAEAINPDWQKRQNSGERGRRGRQGKDENEQEKEKVVRNDISAASIGKMALEAAERNPLLAILNRLPGKNGQRWIVLPFGFCEHGREFKVSLRILLETNNNQTVAENCGTSRALCMALDIVDTPIQHHEAERQWLFVWTSENGGAAASSVMTRLAVYLQPELPPRTAAFLARTLSESLEIPPEHISIKNRSESFPCEAGCGDDLLRPINEAV